MTVHSGGGGRPAPSRHRRTVIAAAVALTCALAPLAAAEARDLTIGWAAEPSSLDPHARRLGPNKQMAAHVFDRLVDVTDEELKLKPMLAVKWTGDGGRKWRFELRRGVTFHDGRGFSAKDVVFTACRIAFAKGGSRQYLADIRDITRIAADGPYALAIETDNPLPSLPYHLAEFSIIAAPKGFGDDRRYGRDGCGDVDYPDAAAFDGGQAMIGTGPYRFVARAGDNGFRLARYDGYWGVKPPWEHVAFVMMLNDTRRAKALVEGRVDLIEKPSLQGMQYIDDLEGFEIVKRLSTRLIYLQFDQFDDHPPGVADAAGKNPFKDRRVRAAISKAIDRRALADRVLYGMAEPTGQLLPRGFQNYVSDLVYEAYDPAGARKLLAEAGYANGFAMTIGTPKDRYFGDEQVTAAIARMLRVVGIRAAVEASSAGDFFKKRNAYGFGAYLGGYAVGWDYWRTLNSLVGSERPRAGVGAFNKGRYSNPRLDVLIAEGRNTADAAANAALARRAARMVAEDYAIVPLHFELTPWAFRKGLKFAGTVAQQTRAMDVKPADDKPAPGGTAAR